MLAVRHAFAMVSLLAALASIGYCFLAMWAGLKFAHAHGDPACDDSQLPAVTILKPLKGMDPEMYESLRSHCLQAYPQYEVLFGVADPSDPAAAAVEALIAEFPNSKLRLVLCPARLGTNGKVSALAQLAPHAAYEHLLVNDSDIHVEQNYLRTVMSELSQSGIGMVTCLYRGAPGGTLGSKIEALGIGTDFMPGVLAARALEGGLRFGLGSTLAFRRRELEAIGGFQSIADYLADDYELGSRIARQGLKITVSCSVVETQLPNYDLAGFFSHQLRWARTIRVSRPAGYFGLLLTFTLPWAIALAVLSPGIPSLCVFAAALSTRLAMAGVNAGAVLRDHRSTRLLWLVPLRDIVAAVVWFCGLFGRQIIWRGERFRLEKGKLKRL